ncbi:hypothetical protein SEPCBS119000_006608 [Sporothrix epigloea]|uniref:Protein Zds1 C-terminal domain-containing protein n=1 Tax=Sporothrix epigloea TaxID=1892477 RepID=A0ABP0E493_9PEZI
MSDMEPASSAADPFAVNGAMALRKAQTFPLRTSNWNGNSTSSSVSPPSSPHLTTPSLREPQSAPQGTSQFPLTNIDNPNDIAQELSNLQALRRMSMDVGNSADPDLMPFQGLSLMAMPSIAPSGEDDEGDISRLLWVPAKVHPELAPDQFKNFLEKRVQSMKRRSGDQLLSADGKNTRADGSLGRKRSMLSRQVEGRNNDGDVGDNSDFGDKIGDDRRTQRANSQQGAIQSASKLGINELVKDPSKIVEKLTLDTQRQSNGLEELGLDDDKPILVAPTTGLRRSTRTAYRKGGSLRSDDRVPFSKRSIGARQLHDKSGKEAEERADLIMSSDFDFSLGHRLQRANSEPVTPDSFPSSSRPEYNWLDSAPGTENATSSAPDTSSDARSTAAISSPYRHPRGHATEAATSQPIQNYPQRFSSQKQFHHSSNQAQPALEIPPPQSLGGYHQSPLQQPTQEKPSPTSSANPARGGSAHSGSDSSKHSVAEAAPSQILDDLLQHPSTLPGSDSTRTDSLTYIPISSINDKRPEIKARDKDELESGKSMSWKWFKSEDRDKKKKEKGKDRDKGREKDRGREKEKDDHSRKSRIKPEKSHSEKAHDGARLDILQNSIDSSSLKGRESLLLDRDSIGGKTFEEKTPEQSNRKAGESKKDKEGFFGSFFGGSRRKENKDTGTGKGRQRVPPPESTTRLLRPNTDYPYSRFPIAEERAIYRMAHIKLADSRRDLRSQVLLSNFMYSYLAKVQAMHPQLNVPTSPQQKRQEEERKRREQALQQQQYLEQQMLLQQQQQQQQHQSQQDVDHYDYEYTASLCPNNHDGELVEQTHDRTHKEGQPDSVGGTQLLEDDDSRRIHNVSMGNQTQRQESQQHRLHGEHTETYGSGNSGTPSHGYYDYDRTANSPHDESDMW